MANKGNNMNMTRKNTGKKALIAVFSVICALIVVLTLFIFLKGPLYFVVAQNKLLKNDFVSAAEWAERSGTDEADILAEYLALRKDINEGYGLQLVAFDIESLRGWKERADSIAERAALCPKINPSIISSMQEISLCIGDIDKVVADYAALKPSVMKLMELFEEYGRLYTKGADGQNITFTVNEEILKLNEWDAINESVSGYAASFSEGAQVYLLNYLIQEARGESALLRQSFGGSTYDAYEQVRLEGENTRVASTIQNGTESLSLLEKEKFERYMYEEICAALTARLARFVVY